MDATTIGKTKSEMWCDLPIFAIKKFIFCDSSKKKLIFFVGKVKYLILFFFFLFF
jgi:hypothetical protein